MKNILYIIAILALVSCGKTSAVKPNSTGTMKVNIASGDVANITVTDNGTDVYVKFTVATPFTYSFSVNKGDNIVIGVGYTGPITFTASLNDKDLDTAPAVAGAIKTGNDSYLSFKYSIPQ